MLDGSAERSIIVDGVYDKQILDIGGPELLEEVGEYDDSVEQTLQDAYGDDGEDDRTGDDPYGGMPLELYDNIVEFKRSGTYPANIGVRHDRSALSHWRARCLRFVLADDNETLLYYNPSSSVNDQPKVVVKKGEVRRVIERIHDLIGHLGQKRTQIVVLKKLHWRSVRQDVKTFINSCAFCNQKKLEGKKILKAPVDVTSDNFDLNIEVRNKTLANGEVFDRLTFSLIGYNEQEVRAAAVTRMTAYTFKETASELRGRFPRPGTDSGTTTFRRQPYIKRTRYSPYASGFIVPYAGKHKNDEPGFIEVFQDERDPPLSTNYSGQVYTTEELSENQQTSGTAEAQHNVPVNIPRDTSISVKTEAGAVGSSQLPSSSKRDITIPRLTTYSGGRHRKSTKSIANLGLASRFNVAVGENADRADPCDNELLLPSYEAVHTRPEMSALPPIMLMPSVDPEVIHMQKELLLRQLRLQRIQEKVLQAQYNSLRLPIARYLQISVINAKPAGPTIFTCFYHIYMVGCTITTHQH
ncbi:hypothetical protein OESDEN_03983 [Oesophagostomum dentatum]|uniref:Integrase zinc-binding domain-containing protein n=1 Tax=Oesophagostomum dentatum TaxID=61180 RepID=A0A0B1TFN4_OESDE|nr:hypothetical protein OESDEN_03983 [Oesophagostomum dentatum]